MTIPVHHSPGSFSESIPPEPISAARRGFLRGLAGQHRPGRIIPRLAVSAACANQGACVDVCRTGALSRYRNDAAVGLRFDAAACDACGRCQQVCPERAVALTGAAAAPEAPGPVQLTSFRLRRCGACLSSFAAPSSEALCPACRRRRALAASLFGTHRATQGAGHLESSSGDPCHE